MKAIICLGNPGEKHTLNRHNAGFLVGKHLIKEHHFSKVGKKFKSLLYKGQIEGEDVLLLFPHTYMNASGEAAQPFLAFYKLPVEEALVVFDDFDIPFNSIKLRKQGGAGTHNGMKSLVQHLKSKDFPRLRFGVGPLPEKWDVSDFVLSNFTTEEQGHLESLYNRSSQFISSWIKEGLDVAMNKFN